MRVIVSALTGIGLIWLSGCAQSLQPPAPRSANLKCVDAAADAVSLGRGLARSHARAALAQDMPDAKGFLVSSGVRRVRVVSRRVDCRPSQIAPSLTKCTAHARLCGI
jgi:hypothetical protein